MKYQALLYLSALLLFFGCQKDDKFSYDQTQRLEFSSDSVLFDTVFTSVGSVTQRIKVFNRAKKAVRISEIKLEGAGHSPFSININGVPANQLSDVEIPGNDSIYVFVKVTIDPNSSENPFLIADSLRFSSNNNQQYLHLRAYGQNARFIKGGVIDTDTSWDDKLPWVIYDSVKINPGKTLTVGQGTRIYFHKGAKMEVSGTLRVNGSYGDSVTFSSDRMERIYMDEPGQWKGIVFTPTSKDNVINHAAIKNAIIGLQCDSLASNTAPKLILANSTIRNMEIAGIVAYNSSVAAFNNTISNCNKHLIYCSSGGEYDFKQNTLVNLNSRSTPSLYFNDNAGASNTFPLSVALINNIIWGSIQNELLLESKGAASSYLIRTNLIKSGYKDFDTMGNFRNQEPGFLDAKNYNFRLMTGSPAENKGEDLSSDPYFSLWLSKDYSEKERIFPSELGSYEIF